MTIKTNIVAVQFESRNQPGTFDGREYSYFTEVPLSAGDIVKAPTRSGSSTARIARINVPESSVPYAVKQIMRHITSKPLRSQKSPDAPDGASPKYETCDFEKLLEEKGL